MFYELRGVHTFSVLHSQCQLLLSLLLVYPKSKVSSHDKCFIKFKKIKYTNNCNICADRNKVPISFEFFVVVSLTRNKIDCIQSLAINTVQTKIEIGWKAAYGSRNSTYLNEFFWPRYKILMKIIEITNKLINRIFRFALALTTFTLKYMNYFARWLIH